MQTEKETTKISKLLSLILRHQPETIGITLDENGWTDVETLIKKINQHGISLDADKLAHVVETNLKKRFSFNEPGDKIRASQGHSVDVDLGYDPAMPPVVLYHGTAEKNINSILSSGLEKQKRHHVHLSEDVNTAVKVGQRHGKPVVLAVSAAQMHADGYLFFVSLNGVWFTENVPATYIKLQLEQT